MRTARSHELATPTDAVAGYGAVLTEAFSAHSSAAIPSLPRAPVSDGAPSCKPVEPAALVAARSYAL